MKSILDPSFRYVPSESTDLRKTFSRIRLEMQRAGTVLRRSEGTSSTHVRMFARPHGIGSSR